jgi:hypothetical protein
MSYLLLRASAGIIKVPEDLDLQNSSTVRTRFGVQKTRSIIVFTNEQTPISKLRNVKFFEKNLKRECWIQENPQVLTLAFTYSFQKSSQLFHLRDSGIQINAFLFMNEKDLDEKTKIDKIISIAYDPPKLNQVREIPLHDINEKVADSERVLNASKKIKKQNPSSRKLQLIEKQMWEEDIRPLIRKTSFKKCKAELCKETLKFLLDSVATICPISLNAFSKRNPPFLLNGCTHYISYYAIKHYPRDRRFSCPKCRKVSTIARKQMNALVGIEIAKVLSDQKLNTEYSCLPKEFVQEVDLGKARRINYGSSTKISEENNWNNAHSYWEELNRRLFGIVGS